MLVIERQELNPSHVYPYHNEDCRPGGGLYRARADDGNYIRRGYENPYPLNDTHFLVSLFGAIVIRDCDGQEMATLLAARRCASCHEPDANGIASVPRKWYLRISEPEKNNFLLAPLALAAGGAERCGHAVFDSADDPDYRAIMETFTPIRELIAERPRMDMKIRNTRPVSPMRHSAGPHALVKSPERCGLIERFDIDIAELNQGRRTCPLAVSFASVVL